MQKDCSPLGPLTHLFREPVLPDSKNSESGVIKYEERWETFQDFIINVFKNSQIIHVSSFMYAIFNHYTKQYSTSVLERAIQTTCTEDPNEAFIRRDYFQRTLALRFGSDIESCNFAITLDMHIHGSSHSSIKSKSVSICLMKIHPCS